MKASSTKAGGKPAGAIMGRKIGGIGAGKKAGDAWAGEKSAGAGKQAGSRWLPFVAVAVVAVAIIAAIILGMGKLPPSAPPSPSRAVNISSLDELCSYLKGSIADAVLNCILILILVKLEIGSVSFVISNLMAKVLDA